MTSLFTIMDDRKDQKFFIRELLLQRSPRINLYHNSSGYSNVWKRFWLVQLDGEELDVAVCSSCFGILTCRPKDGTSGLKKHACIKHRREVIPDLADRMPAGDLAVLLEKAKLSQRKTTKSARDPYTEPAASSQYSADVDRSSPSYHIDNDEEDMSVNQSEEELNAGVNEGLNGPYLLKKETHCSTILDQLLRDDTYTDVTLTAEGQNIRAHKVVLSLSSGYFREVLDRDSSARNVVFFKDLKFDHLRNIINFIYTGEATIDAGELESFMNTAQMLEISSLSDGYKNLPKVVFKTPAKSNKRSSAASSTPRKSQKLKSATAANRRSLEEMVVLPEIKTEPEDPFGDDMDEPSYAYEQEELDIDSKTDITDFSSTGKPSSEDHQYFTTESIADNEQERVGPTPGKCPYCSYKEEKKKFADMMKHLLVNHPCKPAYPCELCSRVYVKRTMYTSHQKSCASKS